MDRLPLILAEPSFAVALAGVALIGLWFIRSVGDARRAAAARLAAAALVPATAPPATETQDGRGTR